MKLEAARGFNGKCRDGVNVLSSSSNGAGEENLLLVHPLGGSVCVRNLSLSPRRGKNTSKEEDVTFLCDESDVINQTQINGEGFRAELDQSTVVIPEGCRIQQPGEQLEARQCRWNWTTDEVLATGGVRVERESNNQITEAETLTGTVGDEGTLTFSAPGKKVRSQLTIEEETGGQDRNSKRSQAPVVF